MKRVFKVARYFFDIFAKKLTLDEVFPTEYNTHDEAYEVMENNIIDDSYEDGNPSEIIKVYLITEEVTLLNHTEIVGKGMFVGTCCGAYSQPLTDYCKATKIHLTFI